MKKAAAALAGPLWLAWGALQWAFALSLSVFMRGFFPPVFETLLAWRLPWAAGAMLLSAAATTLPRAAAAGAAAAASLWLSPVGGGGGAAAMAAAAAAWIPFLLMPRPACAPEPRDAGSELAAALLAALVGPGLPGVPIAMAAAATARLGPRPGRLALGSAAAAWVVFRLLLTPLGLGGWSAAALCVPAGLGAVAAFADAVAFVRGLPPSLRRAAAALAAAALAVAAASAARAMEARPDWSHAAQGLLLWTAWAAVWLFSREAVPATGLGEGRAAAAGAAALALCLVGARTAASKGGEAARRALGHVLGGGAAEDPLFAELWARMGRPDRTPPPWDNPPPPKERTPAFKPDIFVFVVDSLRPDRLGRPGRTPALDALARESAAFPRAFTPYGGTHLAVPALWAGALVAHGPLPVPFAPVNALERLLTEEGYRKLVAPDIHVQAVTQGPPAWETFDGGHSILRRACPALGDLGRRLAPRRPGEAPLFAYAHLFDLHIAARDPAGEDPTAPPGARAVAAYDHALSSLDACLGAFVVRLKASGRYEGSVIVVTSDHGDSLGEEGRWGHAHTAFPEVLRVPLLLKVPKRLTAGLSADTSGAAMLTDLAPTLARLLGRARGPRVPGAGRSLLLAPGDPPAPEGGLLVASSYAPVFGVLSPAGDELFLADAVDRAFHLYSLPERAPAVRLPMDAARLEREKSRLRAVATSAARARG